MTLPEYHNGMTRDEWLDHKEKRPTAPEVGMGATVYHWTDTDACTIFKVSASGKTFWMRTDKATPKDGWKPDFIPGGFSVICTNDRTQDYTYEEDPNGKVYRVSMTKKGWRVGGMRGGSMAVSLGVRHYYYDYNF